MTLSELYEKVDELNENIERLQTVISNHKEQVYLLKREVEAMTASRDYARKETMREQDRLGDLWVVAMKAWKEFEDRTEEEITVPLCKAMEDLGCALWACAHPSSGSVNAHASPTATQSNSDDPAE